MKNSSKKSRGVVKFAVSTWIPGWAVNGGNTGAAEFVGCQSGFASTSGRILWAHHCWYVKDQDILGRWCSPVH
ncbi:unnamed protein product, partial [Staurois parvus]